MTDNFYCSSNYLYRIFNCNNKHYDFIFNWKIENYSISLPDDENDILCSPKFSIERFKELKWFLSITVDEDEDEVDKDKYSISCFLNRDEDDSQIEEIFLDFEIEIECEQWNIDPPIFQFENQSFLKDDRNGGKATIWVKNIHSDRVSKLSNNLVICCKISNLSKKRVKRSRDEYISYIKPTTNNVNLKTIVCTNNCTFKWVVENKISPNLNEEKIFYLPHISPLKVRLICRKKYVSVQIFRLKVWPYLNLLAFLSLRWLGANGIVKETIHSSYYFGVKDYDDIWNFDAFSISYLETATPSETQKLTFIFDFSASNGLIQYEGDILKYDLPGPYPIPSYFFQTISPLQEELGNISMDGDSCDITFIVEGEKFRAHQSIIEIRFPGVIDRLNQQYVVEISDVDWCTFSIMLNYVYTGKVNNITGDNYLKLLVAANKYKLIHLLSVCKMYLINNIRNINIIEAFQIVDEECDWNDLKAIVFKYMSRNRDFLRSKEWNNLAKTGNTDLSNRILKIIRTWK